MFHNCTFEPFILFQGCVKVWDINQAVTQSTLNKPVSTLECLVRRIYAIYNNVSFEIEYNMIGQNNATHEITKL